jgi:hypothetical protein
MAQYILYTKAEGRQRYKIIINLPLILNVRGGYFFAGKPHKGAFQGIFRGGLDVLDPKIVLHYSPEMPIMRFAQGKK